MTDTIIRWNLSQPIYTPEGEGLSHIYYNTDLVHGMDKLSGHPDDGARHSLVIASTITNLTDWLGMVRYELGAVAEPFVEAIKYQIKLYLEDYYASEKY